MLSDLRLAFRQLVKAPGFTATIVITLALSLGACVTIFVLINSVLLQRYGADPARSVVLGRVRPPSTNVGGFPMDQFPIWRKELQSFELLTGHFQQGGIYNVSLTGEGEPLALATKWIAERFFEFHKGGFTLGRGFLPEEHVGERATVVILSHGLWQRVFGGRKDILGRSLVLNGTPCTVVGVFPLEYLPPEDNAELFFPALTSSESREDGKLNGPARVRGILKPGVTLAQAQAEIDLLAARLAPQFPQIQGTAMLVQPMRDYLTRDSRPVILTLFGAVGCVLLIACANISSLLLIRTTARQREFALRAAFGASRLRLIRQLFIESLLLAGLAGGAGALIAHWTASAFQTYPNIKHLGTQTFEFDGTTTLFAIGLSLLTAVLFGLLPAWLSSKVDLNDALKQGGRGSTESGARGRVRHALVVLEIACATALLAAAGFFVRSFIRVGQVNLGLQPENVVMMRVTMPDDKYGNGEKKSAFADALQSRVAAMPAVEAVGLTHLMPFAWTATAALPVQIEGSPVEDRTAWPRAMSTVVSPGYFAAAGIRLVRGRNLSEHDDARALRVTLINETFARQYFPGENPLGRRVLMSYYGRRTEESFEIVGVVGDATQSSPELPVVPHTYRSFRQLPASQFHLVVRTRGEIAGLAGMLKAQVYAIDPTLPPGPLIRMQEIIDERVANRRLQLHLLIVFSVLALAVAMVGIYGIIAYSVTQRTAEIGIRMALGAQSIDVARLVVTQGARLVGTGLLIGLAAALGIGRIIEARLFQVSAYDPLTLIAITLLIAGAGVLACFVPVRRATKVDPIVALRAE